MGLFEKKHALVSNNNRNNDNNSNKLVIATGFRYQGWQRFTQNPAIFFLERTLNAFQLLISCDSTTDGIIHVQGGQKPGLWGTGKTKRLWASVRRFRPWAESKVIGQERPIIGQDWKQSLVARFATFPGAKWPIFTRIVAIGRYTSII
jgi:hypothetical protein